MAQVTVQQLAEVVGASSERLLTQMKEAGLPHSAADEPVSDEDKQIFTEVMREAAQRATAKIVAREKELVQFFKDQGLTVTEVDLDDFKAAVAEKVTFEEFGYRKEDWEAITAIQ